MRAMEGQPAVEGNQVAGRHKHEQQQAYLQDIIGIRVRPDLDLL